MVVTDCVPLGTSDASTKKNFASFVGLVEKAYGLSLPVPQSVDKEFCSGLLGSCKSSHPWWKAISRLTLRDRLSISGSLFLFRKVLPSKKPSVEAFVSSMSSAAPEPPTGFFEFARRELNSIFRFGWDRKWEGCVLKTIPSVSSCLESPRMKGGARGCFFRGDTIGRALFVESLLSRYSRYRPNVSRVKLMEVTMSGKSRLVTVNSVDSTALLPYHRLLYDHLSSTQSWLLRGEAKPSSFAGFGRVEDEVFVSGDYESASDNLNADVARFILQTISRRCSTVPLFVREAATQTLRSTVLLPSGGEVVLDRQLMGNPCCFPLLCLQNYLAFKFLIRRDVPVRINGDDIVFRSTRSEFSTWAAGVESLGLKLSLGKTNVESRWFSLNSSFFYPVKDKVKLAPVIRSTAFFNKLEDPSSLSGRVETLRGFGPERRGVLVGEILSRFSRTVWWSQRSLRRGFGVKVSEVALKTAGLFSRESFYLGLPKQFDEPLPVANLGYFKTKIPSGWSRVRLPNRPTVESQREFHDALFEEAWCAQRNKGGVEVNLQGRVAHPPRPAWKKIRRLLGLSWRELRAYRPTVKLPEVTSYGYPQWVFSGGCGLPLRCGAPLFTRAGWA